MRKSGVTTESAEASSGVVGFERARAHTQHQVAAIL